MVRSRKKSPSLFETGLVVAIMIATPLVLFSVVIILVSITLHEKNEKPNIEYTAPSLGNLESTPQPTKGERVSFNQEGISVDFYWNEIVIRPEFDLYIGPALETELSPNKKYLYIATAQGGGIASFIFDIEKSVAYFLGNNARGIGEWLPDGRLKIVNFQHFGENIGEVVSTYQSVNSSEPWIIEEL